VSDLELAPEEGVVSFSVSIAGIDFVAREVMLNNSRVPRVRFKRHGLGHYEVSVFTIDIYDEIQAVSAAQETLDILLARISVHLGARVFDAQLHGSTVPFPPHQRTDKASYRVTAQATIPVDSPVPRPKALTQDDWAKVASALQTPQQPIDLVKVVYRLATSQADPLASFVLLYNILLQLCNDKQADVDGLVRTIQPGVTSFPSPIKAGVMETIYTRLRNEIAHQRPGVSLAQTYAQIKQVLPQFRELVRQALLKHVL
jgi:hypothetical protein